jgi:uridylate kinase
VTRYRRIILKLSGEAIEGDGEVFNLDVVRRIAEEIGTVHSLGVQVGVVVGGGNIIRGQVFSRSGFSRVTSDSMGMLATVINSLLFEEVLKSKGIPARLQSALVIEAIAEGIVPKKTVKYLEDGEILLFAAGTGSPYFTTDTAAALRACEIGADVLLKGTKVEGVYDRDPVIYRDSIFYPSLSYEDVLTKRLGIMDMAAVSMCRDNRIPIVIFNILKEGTLVKIVEGQDIGTIIKE